MAIIVNILLHMFRMFFKIPLFRQVFIFLQFKQTVDTIFLSCIKYVHEWRMTIIEIGALMMKFCICSRIQDMGEMMVVYKFDG